LRKASSDAKAVEDGSKDRQGRASFEKSVAGIDQVAAAKLLWRAVEGLKKRSVSSGIPVVPATLNWVQCHIRKKIDAD
jgi:hypothetical protein